MSGQIYALRAELIKNKHSSVLWVTFIAFALAPAMGGIFMLIMQSPDALAKAGPLSTKVQLMEFNANWSSYFSILTQAVGVGGILVFGFVASWIFGREYSDNTAKDLLSLPTSRTEILNAKFIVYITWCIMLCISNVIIGIVIGLSLQLPEFDRGLIIYHLKIYSTTMLLTIAIGTPIAFFAIWGKGYLAPLGFVALTLVFAQIIAATGYGYYFPWSIPGLFSGAGGEFRAQLNPFSYFALASVSVAGYMLAIKQWGFTDQTK